MKKVLTGLDSREYEHPAGREVMINKKLIINLTILFNLVYLFANPYTCYKSVETSLYEKCKSPKKEKKSTPFY